MRHLFASGGAQSYPWGICLQVEASRAVSTGPHLANTGLRLASTMRKLGGGFLMVLQAVTYAMPMALRRARQRSMRTSRAAPRSLVGSSVFS